MPPESCGHGFLVLLKRNFFGWPVVLNVLCSDDDDDAAAVAAAAVFCCCRCGGGGGGGCVGGVIRRRCCSCCLHLPIHAISASRKEGGNWFFGAGELEAWKHRA